MGETPGVNNLLNEQHPLKSIVTEEKIQEQDGEISDLSVPDDICETPKGRDTNPMVPLKER